MPYRKGNCQLYSCDIQIIKLNIRYLELCSIFGCSLKPEWEIRSLFIEITYMYEGVIGVIALTVLSLQLTVEGYQKKMSSVS